MSHVVEYVDLYECEMLRTEWRSLLEATPGATFFQSFPWLETFLKFHRDDVKLRLLVVCEGGETTGIVPLVLIDEPTKLGALRVLTYPLAYWGSFYGPIGPQPRKTLAAALAYLRDRPRDWDLLDLRFTPSVECDPAATHDALREADFAATPKRTDFTALIDLPASFEAYFAERKPKWRVNYRRWLRRLHEQGALRYVRYRPTGGRDKAGGGGDPRWDLYDDCERIAERSWQGSSTTGTTLTHETVRPFFRAMHETACRHGAADVNLLYLDDQPLAFLYCYRYCDGLFACRTGYDAELGKQGVGNVMYLHAIEDSIARGDKLIDLGPGSLSAKKPLLSRVEPIYRLPHANVGSWRGIAWRAKQALDDLQRIAASYDDEVDELAEAFNAPSARLAHQFDQQQHAGN